MKITLEDIRRLVDEPYFSRGREYSDARVVKIVSLTSKNAKARIAGSRVYTVTLAIKSGKLQGNCSCPAAGNFGPCKHMAATCFAIMDQAADRYRTRDDAFEGFEEYEDWEKHLKSLKKTELIELLLEIAGEYPDIMNY